MSNSIGLYIHIPFCKSKCPYCDFYSKSGCEQEYDTYTNILINKIKYWSSQAQNTVSSIYFGGGTPSVIGANRLCSILSCIKEHFIIESSCEITAEINPDTGKTIDFEMMKKSGFNRISIGLQSAIEKELKELGRIHTIKDAKTTVNRAKNAGIHNISLDLMLGIPYQTLDSLKKSIDFCASCDVTHISTYLLKIEEGTKFHSIKNNLLLPDEDEESELYLTAVEYMNQLGYEQYEISNFAKKGFESKHNIKYWKCGEYIGIGPSAHSYFDGKRFYYERNIENFATNGPIYDCEGGNEEEFIMLNLRLKSGLTFDEYEKKYNHPLPCSVLEKIKKYENMGFMICDDKKAYFTPKGYLVSNTILSDLI